MTSLTNITFKGDAVTTIPSNGFKETQIKSITIPSAVTKIDASTFDGCTQLTSVTFKSNEKLATIGNYAFRNTAISEIEIPGSFTSIGQSAFEGCSSLDTVTFKDVSSTAATIGASAFKGTAIESITIPSIVTSLGANCFTNCENLKKVLFASNEKLATLNAAFQDCANLETVTVLNSDGTEFGYNTVPKSVKSIPSYLFAKSKTNTKITNFTIQVPASGGVTIKYCAFYMMSALRVVTLPANTGYQGGTVSKVNYTCFENCPLLDTIVISGSGKVQALAASYGSGTTISAVKSYIVTPWYNLANTMNRSINIVVKDGVTGFSTYATYASGTTSIINKLKANYHFYIESATALSNDANNTGFTNASTAGNVYYGVNKTWQYNADGIPELVTASDAE
jgi:hypothetical protein